MNLKPYPIPFTDITGQKYKDSGIEWLGEVPEEWEVKRLKYVCNEYAEYGLNIEAENYQSEGIRFIRTTDLDDYGNLKNEGVYINPVLAKDYILKDGDLLISRSGTIGRSFLYESSNNGKATYAGYLVKYSLDSEKAFPKYLFYFTLSHSFYEWLKTQLIETTIGNVNGQKYANMFLPIPPKEEQIRLSTFLDHKTTKIDELIKKNETLVELLKEKRQAVISHAVTKGLDPNAKMKDSGIEWIREIPEKWEVRKLKHLTTEKFKNGIFKKKEFYGSGIKLINVFDVYRQDFYIEIESLDRIEVTSQEIQTYSVKAGDIVFVRSSLKLEGVGASACVPSLSEPLLFECHLVKLQPSSKILPEYLINFLNSSIVRQRLIALANTVTMATLGQSTLTSIEVELPPVFEQQAILIYLISETTKIDELINNILSQIAALKEYRQALISNVVTGKVRVDEN